MQHRRLLSPQTLTTLPRPEPSICTTKRRLSAAIALSQGQPRFRDPRAARADVFTTLTAVPCAPRTRTRGGPNTQRKKGRQRKGKEGVKERGPEGHLSISAGVKWAGACAVLLRTAALSLTPDAAGSAHPCTANVEATAGVPRRGGGVFLIFAAVRAYLERARQRPVSSADGERENARVSLGNFRARNTSILLL